MIPAAIIIIGLASFGIGVVVVLLLHFADSAERALYGTTDQDEIARQRLADREHLAAMARSKAGT